MFKKTFQDILIISVQAVTRGNHKAIIKEGFHQYLNKVQNINSADKDRLHQWLQGVCFALCTFNSGPLDGTDITWSLVAIGKDFSFTIDIFPASSIEGIS